MYLYCTADIISQSSGGGIVTHHESKALQSLGTTINIDRTELSKYEQPDSPFSYDTVADAIILNRYINSIKLAHFYSGTFSRSVDRLRRSNTIVTYTVAAHDPVESKIEFEELGISYNFPHLIDPALWAIYSEGYLAASSIICPSSHSANIMRQIGCKNIKIIPHGTNIPTNVYPMPTRFNVGFLGQAGPDKGIKYLFRSWKSLNWKDSTLIMAGNNNYIINLFHKESSGDIQFRGFVKSPNDLFKDCSVLVAPSVTEGFGIGVLEAMAYGRPPIVSVGAGAADIIEDGIDGYIVPRRDPEAISSCLSRLKDNRDLLMAMSIAARKKASLFTWDNIRQRYIDHWNELCR